MFFSSMSLPMDHDETFSAKRSQGSFYPTRFIATEGTESLNF